MCFPPISILSTHSKQEIDTLRTLYTRVQNSIQLHTYIWVAKMHVEFHFFLQECLCKKLLAVVVTLQTEEKTVTSVCSNCKVDVREFLMSKNESYTSIQTKL